MGRLQSNSSPDVPGLDRGYLSFEFSHSESIRLRWLGFRMRGRFSVSLHSLPVTRRLLCVLFCRRTDVTSKMSHAHISRFFPVSDLCGHLTHLAACMFTLIPCSFFTSLTLNGTEFFMCLPQRHLFILRVWSLFWRTLSSFHTVRSHPFKEITLSSKTVKVTPW